MKQARSLTNLGEVHYELGNVQQSEDFFKASLALKEIHDTGTIPYTLERFLKTLRALKKTKLVSAYEEILSQWGSSNPKE